MDYIHVAKKFAIEVHQSIGHMYDEYLPYEFHLRMTVKALLDFPEVLAAISKRYGIAIEKIVAGQWLHDTMEDVPTRVNYNTLVQLFNPKAKDLRDPSLDFVIPEIVRAVSNNSRGRNREERMTDDVYTDIATKPGATPVKLADRIGNVQYSKMTGSSMFKKYQKENDKFIYKIEGEQFDLCIPMAETLENIFRLK